MGLAGIEYHSLSTTVGTSVSTILNAGVASGSNSQHNGKLLIHNPNSSGVIMLGLGGGLTISAIAPRSGFCLNAGDSIVFDMGEAPQNAITAISDVASTPITIYTIGA